MKHTNPFIEDTNKIIQKIFKKKISLISNVSSVFLSTFASQIKSKTIIFLDLGTIIEVLVEGTDLWMNRGVAFILKEKSLIKTNRGPEGFRNKFKIINDASEIMISSNAKVGVVFCEQGAELEARFESKKEPYSTSRVSHETVIDFLKQENYKQVDKVKDRGEFTIRGGIVDLFDPTKTKPTRISFFNEKPTISHFDILTQTSTETSNIKNIYPNKNSKKISLLDKVKNLDYEKFEYKNNTLQAVEKSVDKSADFEWSPSTLNDYIINRNKYIQVLNVSDLPAPVLTKNSIALVSVEVKNKKNKTSIANFDLSKINQGDFVCHENYGVGLYRGISQKDIQKGEVLVLEYSNKNHIYINIKKIGVLHYFSKAGSDTRLDDINKPKTWRRKKSLAEKNAQFFVGNVVDNFISRSKIQKNKRPVDEAYIDSFVSSFLYTDTPDQASAWKQIKQDLLSYKIMDRLICGDVGFGKTELAIRAAFCVVSSGEQAVVLAPTTLLANQLKTSFKNRLSPFGVNVDMVSRLKKPSEVSHIYKSFSNKQIDVLIGTHKLINFNFEINSVGLVVVDEEHRFGVKQKDSLKIKFKGSDFLMLSATPIPRSLYLGLNNIYQISVLATPPRLRKPIDTQVVFYDKTLIEKTVNFELKRGGQTYIVYNSTKNIESFSKKFFFNFNPYVDYIHGRMNPQKIKEKMNSFSNKKINVLFTTSIIESGIDVATANTIIVINSQNFGLSQLYQIRGRVGRSEVQAFALMVVPKKVDLNSKAIKRLKSIEINNSLGVGYNISKNDLEIRGPGSILGHKQSGKGFVSCGLEMYSKLISNFVELKLDETPKKKTFVDLFSSAGITSQYIENEDDRLFYYRAFSFCLTLKGLFDVVKELEDRYGPLNKNASRLVLENELRILCNNGPIKELKTNKRGEVLVKTHNNIDVNWEKLSAERAYEKTFISNKPSEGLCFSLLNINLNKDQDFKYLKSFINYINEFK
ncbi:MAG: hypothetical protein CBD58_02540 [bacterium TMED198]|nr:MAG: hypothetical protein CBD58_02540 [bacterium TMED198]